MIIKYFIDCGTYKEIIRDDKSLFKCVFCGEWFRALAHHTTQKHGVSGKDLRKMLGLKSKYQLITPELKDRHHILALEQEQSNCLKIIGLNTRYKEGHDGHIKILWSNQAINDLKHR